MERKKRYFEAYTQIIILIVATIAFSYILHESYSSENKNISQVENDLHFNPLLRILSIVNKLIWNEKAIVSADTCTLAENGETCVEYSASDCAANCTAGGCVPTSADDTLSCEIGTCYNTNYGTCALGAHRISCDESNGGRWFDDSEGNIQECELGCCLNGGNANLKTEGACAIDAESNGIDEEFNPSIKTWAACYNIAHQEDKGACLLAQDGITGEFNCTFTTRESCILKRGDSENFFQNTLCSNSELNTICAGEATIMCDKHGKDEVYWFDSCDNQENIYDLNNPRRYDGVVLSKQESCTLTDSNRGICGNCDYLAGSVCGTKTDNEQLDDPTKNIVCRDLGCDEDKNGEKERKNGESWCLYQGAVGVNGDRAVDTPGSRSFWKICQEGEITTTSCGEGRSGVCVENTIYENNQQVSRAKCQPNKALECLTETNLENCANNEYCFVKNVYVAGEFHFSVCAPKYPQVFPTKDLNAEACSIGTRQCTVVYKKVLTNWFEWGETRATKWKCWKNCNCEEPQFGQQMNNLCVSLGDCGAEVNYKGRLTTEGQSISGHRTDPLNSAYLAELSSYSNDVSGQKIDIEFATSFSSLGSFEELEQGVEGPTEQEEAMNTISTIIGLAAMIPGIGWVAAIILIAIAGFLKLLGLGKTKEYVLSFNCYQWHLPPGGADCSKCDEDMADGIYCSAYACNSLGSACKFIPENEGSSDPTCVASSELNVAPPLISPWEDFLSENYTIILNEDNPNLGFELRTKGTDDGCVKTNTKTNVGISLDQLGSCRYSFVPFDAPATSLTSDDPENMEYTDEQMESSEGIYDFSNRRSQINHNATIYIPGARTLGLENFDPNAQADYNMYIRCSNINDIESGADYVIRFCAKPGRDAEPPNINSIKEPRSNFVKYNSTEQNLTLYTEEPANCSWSSSDKDYDSMENKMECKNSMEERTLFGWLCNSTLPITGNGSQFYIRCIDLSGNKNGQSRQLTLTKTSKLEITYARPNNETITFGTPVGSVKVEVRTSGGLSGGPTCLASDDEERYLMVLTPSAGGIVHKITLNENSGNNKKIWIKCEDRVGNVAIKEIIFNVRTDSEAPKITRVYSNYGNLIIKTNELASCALSLEKCSFNFANSTLKSGSAFEHSFSVEKNKVYYAKCKDGFNNGEEGMCTHQFKLV